jgi:hypothetical protein
MSTLSLTAGNSDAAALPLHGFVWSVICVEKREGFGIGSMRGKHWRRRFLNTPADQM